MGVDVLLGLQWGDEGKGKIVDVLTKSYNIIARFQGGPNAGHTLEFNGIKHVLHTIPSGIFHENKINIIGNGVVIDPWALLNEIEEIKKQGMAALLPNISLSGQTTWNEYYQLGELQNEYNSFSQAARISQPLLRLDTWFNFRRSKFLTDASEADFAFQQQNLIVRTAELYFNVLRSIDNLNAAISEEVAIKKQLDQTKQRYEVGLSAITEVQEAQLAYDVSLAAKIRREGEVFTAREALNALVGREIVSVDALVNAVSYTHLTLPTNREV